MAEPAVFLDRDGVINVSPRHQYVRSWEEFAFLPGSLKALQELTQAGFRLIVVSNQQGVAKEAYTQEALDDITTRMKAAVREAGGRLDAVLYCTHADETQCPCRKPRRGLIDQACQRYPIDLKRSFVIGDDPKDIALGQAVGCTTLLVFSGRTPPEMVSSIAPPPDHCCQDLRAAADWILRVF